MGLIGGIRAREIGIRALALYVIHLRVRSQQYSIGALSNERFDQTWKNLWNLRLKLKVNICRGKMIKEGITV